MVHGQKHVIQTGTACPANFSVHFLSKRKFRLGPSPHFSLGQVKEHKKMSAGVGSEFGGEEFYWGHLQISLRDAYFCTSIT